MRADQNGGGRVQGGSKYWRPAWEGCYGRGLKIYAHNKKSARLHSWAWRILKWIEVCQALKTRFSWNLVRLKHFKDGGIFLFYSEMPRQL